MRVLIVEDEWEVAMLIETGLGDYGFTVDMAGDAKETQLRLAETEYDIVFLTSICR